MTQREKSLVSCRNFGQFDMEFLLLAAVARGADYPWRARKWIHRCYGPLMGWSTVSKVFHRMEHVGWVAMERERRGKHLLRRHQLTTAGKEMLHELQGFYSKVCGMGPQPETPLSAGLPAGFVPDREEEQHDGP